MPEIITHILSIAVPVLGAVWWLTSRFERIRADLAVHSDMVQQRFAHLNKELENVRDSIDVARKERNHIWNEVNSLRERVAAEEARGESM